jgi:thiol-disulfide isomerase/thioredoxin
MEAIKNYFARINALPNSKKLILVLIVVVVLFIIVEFVMSSANLKNSIVNHSNVDQFKNDEDEDQEEEEEEEEYEDPKAKPKKISLDSDKLNLTLFFAHWCGHCKKFVKDTWSDLKKKYKNHDSVQLNDVDCTNIKTKISTPKGNDIEGFPTIIINYKDKSGDLYEEEYKGGRSIKHLEGFINKMIKNKN